LGGVVDRTRPRTRASEESAFSEALADVEFIEACLGRFQTTHVAGELAQDVVAAVKRQLIDGRSGLFLGDTSAFSIPRIGTPDRRAPSRGSDDMLDTEDAQGSGIETITLRAAESGMISDGLASIIAHMGRNWMDDGSFERREY
jgi:hypothetical protein